MSNYLIQWIKLSKTEEKFKVKEQFINSCPMELAVHLHERAPKTLEEIAKIAVHCFTATSVMTEDIGLPTVQL